MTPLLGILLSLIAIFLILLILVQRGRGGGLAGALGGMGGSSAFGAKAGDVFTRITAVAALIWIVLCMITAKWGATSESRLSMKGPAGNTMPGAAATLDADEPKDGEKSDDAAASTSAPAESAPGSPPAEADSPASSAPAEPAPPATEP